MGKIRIAVEARNAKRNNQNAKPGNARCIIVGEPLPVARDCAGQV